MKTQPKRVITTFDDADNVLAELGALQAYVAGQEAELNQKEQQLREHYQRATAEARQKIEELTACLERWCIQNKHEFERTRMRDLVHGVIGFRTNPPKVSLLNRKYTMNTVLELLKKLRMTKYIRVKEELDKETILSDYLAQDITDTKLASVGLKVDQTEQFVCEPKWEQLQQ